MSRNLFPVYSHCKLTSFVTYPNGSTEKCCFTYLGDIDFTTNPESQRTTFNITNHCAVLLIPEEVGCLPQAVIHTPNDETKMTIGSNLRVKWE